MAWQQRVTPLLCVPREIFAIEDCILTTRFFGLLIALEINHERKVKRTRKEHRKSENLGIGYQAPHHGRDLTD